MNLSILIIDNDSSTISALRDLLEDHCLHDISLFIADSIQSSIEIISHNKISVILLNLSNIEIDQSSIACTQLRSIYLYSPIIAITNHNESIDLSNYKSIGIDDCLDISILTPNILYRVISSSITRSLNYQNLYANNQRKLISNQLLKLLLEKTSTAEVAQSALRLIHSHHISTGHCQLHLLSIDEDRCIANIGEQLERSQIIEITTSFTNHTDEGHSSFYYSRKVLNAHSQLYRVILPLINKDKIAYIFIMDTRLGLIHPSEERKYLKLLSETLSDILIRSAERERFDQIYQQNVRLIEQMSSAAIAIDKLDTVTHWNNLSELYFGLSKDEAMSKRLFDLNINCDWPVIIEKLYESLNENTRSDRFEVTYNRQDSESPRLLSVSITPFIDPNGLYSGYLLLMDDITEKKHMEKLHQQSMYLESIGQLAAGIAHEINTPMQYIGDNLNFLRDSFNDAAKAISKIRSKVIEGTLTADHLTDILDEADYEYLEEELPLAFNQTTEGVSRVCKIVQAMKEYSHPNSEKKVATDINKAIESTVTISKHTWKYHSDMELSLDTNLPNAICHPGPLNEVLLNIIVNAADAIRENLGDSSDAKIGKICVCSRTVKNDIEITITDNGGGIPEDVQPRIFDPFFTTKEVGKGTGQGLALSYSIIKDRHNGHLSFTSVPGVGTTFTIRIPIQADVLDTEHQ